MISIITRAYNRLEYTMMVIRSVHEQAKGAEYEHIIVEQNSTDGTREWLKSIEVEGFYNIKVKYNDVNSGDAGGMKDGFDMVDEKSTIIMQLDNDLTPTTNDFIRKIINVFNDDKIGGLMLYRDGVVNHLPMTRNIKTIGGIKLYTTIPFIYVMRRDLLDTINYWKSNEKIGWVRDIANKIKSKGYEIYKTPDIRLNHIDTTYGQQDKYHKYFNTINIKSSNYKEIDYQLMYNKKTKQ